MWMQGLHPDLASPAYCPVHPAGNGSSYNFQGCWDGGLRNFPFIAYYASISTFVSAFSYSVALSLLLTLVSYCGLPDTLNL